MLFEIAKQGRNNWYLYLAGILIILFAWQFIGAIPMGIVVGVLAASGKLNPVDLADPIRALANSELGKNTTLAIILLMFVCGFFAVLFVVHFLHRRPILTVFTSRERFDWKRFAFGFSVWFLMGAFFEFYAYFSDPQNYVFALNWEAFIPLVLICITLLPLQTSFEELFFRGYLMQSFGVAGVSRIIPLFSTAILFGMLHFLNPEVKAYGLEIMAPFYIGMGLFLGIVAIMDNGLEQVLGIHFANNFMSAVLFSSNDSALVTDALFHVKEYNPKDSIFMFFVLMILYVLLSSKMYQWNNWERLFQKII